MDATNADLAALRCQQQTIARRDTACMHDAGDNEPGARQREGAIDRKAKAAVFATFRHRRRRSVEDRLQVVDPITTQGRDWENVRLRQHGPMQQCLNFRDNDSQPPSIDLVDLRHDGDTARDAEKVQDRQMFARLRHDPVVGGHDEQNEIDTRRTGQHGAHKLLVARHIDETDRSTIARSPVGKAEIDRNAALLLLRQSIGIDAGQRLDQGCLAVIDMAGRGDDHGRRGQGLTRSTFTAFVRT